MVRKPYKPGSGAGGVIGKYTCDRVRVILDSISKGLSRTASARKAGINPITLVSWMNKKPEFRRKVLECELKREEYLVGVIEAGSEKDWRAAKFLLQTRHVGWGEGKTSQENRDLIDRLKVMEQALSVKLQAIRVQQASLGGDDYDIIDILNEIHGIEENFDGNELQLGAPKEGEEASSVGAKGSPDKEEEPDGEGKQEESEAGSRDSTGQVFH